MMTTSVIAPTPTVIAKTRRLRIDVGSILLSAPAFLAVVGLFIYPFISGILVSLHSVKFGYFGQGGPLTLQNFGDFLHKEGGLESLWITFTIAFPTTMVGLLISIPLAYYMRHGMRFERLITALLLIPMSLGTVMVAEGMLTYFASYGWFNHVLTLIHLTRANGDPLFQLHTSLAVDASLFIQGFPFVFLLTLGYMSAINPDLERASRMMGASEWQTFWRVVLPLALPGLAIAFCLSFVANFSVFPSASLVGDPSGTTRTIAVAAYYAYGTEVNPPLGTTMALIMGAVELTVIAFVLWLRSLLARSAAISGGKGA